MKKKLLLFLQEHWAIVTFLFVYFIVLAAKLINNPTPFFDWDESLYLQLGKEMIERKSFIPSWQGTIWLDKPPLIPFFYGLVYAIPFIQPEISTRIATLLLSCVSLSLAYKLYYKVIKETTLTTLMIVLTAFTPIFLQRAQVINIDVFLLLGWLGYVVFYKRFWLSLLFLGLAVFSKSLLGFYPVVIMGIYHLYLVLFKKIDRKAFFAEIKKMAMHIGILSLYYILMFAIYGQAFWTQHIYENHFRRVGSSLEFHFGHRTYYIDVVAEQFTKLPLFLYTIGTNFILQPLSLLFFIITLVSVALLVWKYYKKNQIKEDTVLRSLYLTPWFVFLNVAKTKIAWYAYPVIPNFSFLLLYPITLLRKQKLLYYAAVAVIFLIICFEFIGKRNLLAQNYSKIEPHHRLATFASSQCDAMVALVEQETRDSFKTLEDSNLLITTSKWWGSRPSMVYYFNKKIEYLYTVEELEKKQISKGTCIVVDVRDRKLVEDKQVTLLKEFKPWLLFKK